MNITVKPSRHRRLEDVQRVLRSIASRGNLRHVLKAFLHDRSRLGPCCLWHIRYRPRHTRTSRTYGIHRHPASAKGVRC
jgi:hypothetical protein